MRGGPWEAGFGLSLVSVQPHSWSGAPISVRPQKAASEPSSVLTCSSVEACHLEPPPLADWSDQAGGNVPLLSPGEQAGRGRGWLPLYSLAYPSHQPPPSRQSPGGACWGTRGGAQFTWRGSVASAKESTLPHPCLLHPPPLPPKLLRLFLTAFPAPFGSAWGHGHQRPHRRP